MKDISVMIEDVKFNYRVGLIIEKGNEILIEFCTKSPSTTVPGGRVKTLENSVVALKREIQEEMHYELKDDEITLNALIENFFEINQTKYHELYILYKMTLPKEDNRFPNHMKNYDSDSAHYEWIEKSKLKDINLLPTELISLASSNSFQHIIVNDLKEDKKVYMK